MKLPTRMNIVTGALLALCVTQAYQLFFVSDNLSDSGWEASDSHSPFLKSMQAFKHALMFATESDEVVDYSGWFEEDESVQHVAPTPCENSLQRPEAGTSNRIFAAETDVRDNPIYRDSSGWHYNRIMFRPHESKRLTKQIQNRVCNIKEKEYQ